MNEYSVILSLFLLIQLNIYHFIVDFMKMNATYFIDNVFRFPSDKTKNLIRIFKRNRIINKICQRRKSNFYLDDVQFVYQSLTLHLLPKGRREKKNDFFFKNSFLYLLFHIVQNISSHLQQLYWLKAHRQRSFLFVSPS